MAIQTTTTGHRIAPVATVEQVPSAQRATESPQSQSPQGSTFTELLAAGQARAAQLVHTFTAIPASNQRIMLVSAVTVAGGVFIASGFMHTRTKEALRDLAAKAEDIRIPPVLIAELVWELLADRRAVSSAATRRPTRY